VIVTRSGGMVESVVDGETGFIIDKRDPDALADRLLKLLRDKKQARKIGARGRWRAIEFFSRERMARETAKLYQAAIEASRTRSMARIVA
jgi:glycosyltransferase involved in cell wall biosynthesis